MNSKPKILLGALLVVLLGVLLVNPFAIPANSPGTSPGSRPSPATVSPAPRVLKPTAPPAVAHTDTPVAPGLTGNDTVDLQNAAADMAKLLRAGDIKTFAERYAPVGEVESVVEFYERIQNEPGTRGSQRMEIIAGVFAAIGQQEPLITPIGQFKFNDYSLYNPSRYPADTAPDQIPVYFHMPTPICFIKENGQLHVTLATVALLGDASHNVPLQQPEQ